MSSRQKMIIDWLGAVGDWFRTNLVAATTMFFDRLTFRRVVLFVGLMVLAAAFAQVFTADVAIVFAGDMMLYFEVATAVMLIVARERLQMMLPVVAAAIRKVLQNPSDVLRRLKSRQRRNANATKRQEADRTKQADDEPAAWEGAGYVFA
jgi:hypothetical protein